MKGICDVCIHRTHGDYATPKTRREEKRAPNPRPLPQTTHDKKQPQHQQ